MRSAGVVFAKEMLDNLRDRRSLFMALVYPFIGALFLGLLLALVGGALKGQSAGSPSLAVEGQAHAPALARWLEGRGVRLLPAPEEPQAAVRAGRVDAVLRVPADFGGRLAAGATAEVDMLVNASRLDTVVTVTRVVQLLREWAEEVGRERLAARGIDAETARPLRINQVNVGKSRSLAGFLLNMLPPFLVFTIFVGGVYIAIDTTAGERERGSLEPLFANPVPRWQFLAGKAAAACAFTLTALCLQLFAFKAMFELVARADYGIAVNPGLGAFLLTVLLALPLVGFAVALQLIVATMSRSYKETQTYLGLLPLLPSLPGMLLVFVPLDAGLWATAVPTFGQAVLIGRLMREEAVAADEVAVSVAATLLAAALLFRLAARLYDRDALPAGG